MAKQLANNGNPVILLNGFAKVCIVNIDPNNDESRLNLAVFVFFFVLKLCKSIFKKDTRSVPNDATMAYYLKPLTYNSQIAGYLLRCYPGQWTVVTSTSAVLASYTDDDILVPGTNTPDLRQSVKLVQKYVDEQAILARNARI
jgi:Domain of unknown function (DUF1995)